MITFERLLKVYKSGFASKKKVIAVNDVSLSISKGEIYGIIGPNGAGKSSMLKMLLGFIRPDSGHISVFGLSPELPQSRKNMGYLPENPYYYDHLSAEDLLMFSGKASGMSSRQINEKIDQLLHKLDLEHARKRKLRTYSKGMTQRAGICFSLIHDPDIVIFDEPMSGLDPLGRKLVVDLMLDLKNRGKTVLFCSHILNDIERLCDKIAMMDLGRLKDIFTKKDIIDKYSTANVKVENFPQRIEDDLKSKGFDCDLDIENNLVTCKQNELPDVILFLKSHQIGILDVSTESNLLEKIFTTIIEKRDMNEAD